MADISYYLDRITSEHVTKVKFSSTVAALIQPLADTTFLMQHYYQYYDLDLALGVQLDAVGIWVGRSRFLPVPIDAYFTLDRAGFGLDEAAWKRAFDPDTGLVELPDEAYRTLLRAVIVANHWDGTIPGAYAAYDVVFYRSPFTFLIQDYGNGEMAQALIGAKPPDQITLGLFNTGELDLKPAGIRLWHILPITYPAGPGGTPLFGLDASNPTVNGLDVGAWANFFAPE